MESHHDFISQINPTREDWKLKIRVIHLWNVFPFGNTNERCGIEMVLLDSKGDKIQATINKSLIRIFQYTIHEGEAYMISDFRVGQNSGDYKPTDHTYKLNFNESTKVVNVGESNIPRYGFGFIPFGKILSNSLDDTCLIDIIGYLNGVVGPETLTRNGNPLKKLIIQLEDLQKNTVSCTLWNQYADQLESYLSEHKNCQVIIIIQFAKVKPWQGAVRISSSLFATRLLINPTLPEVEDFKQRFGKVGTTSSDLVTQINNHPQKAQDEFLRKSDRKKIDEIRETNEVRNCVTLATIDSIEISNGWFYNACKKDYKKVKEIFVDGIKKFQCEKCNNVVDPIPRYKVQIRVVDDSGSATFVLFEREVVQLVGKSALFLSQCQPKLEEFPKDLDALLKRKILFKIKITDYNLTQNWPVFTVMKMSEDKELIKTFQEMDDIEKTIEFEDYEMNSATTKLDMATKNIDKDCIAKESEATSEICSNSCMTPKQNKQLTDHEGDSNEVYHTSSEFSTNKRRRMIVVKEEKKEY